DRDKVCAHSFAIVAALFRNRLYRVVLSLTKRGVQPMKCDVSSTRPRGSALGLLRRPYLAVGAVVVFLLGSIIALPRSYARVNPLVVIERQLHKANMLISLDTSGSMAGVPGGQFANSTEAGVDCDNGAHCRNGGVQGLCKLWGRVCMSDDDCRTGYCQKDGVTACSTSDDCPQDPGSCSIPTTNCTLGINTQTGTNTGTITGTQTATNTLTNTSTQTATNTQSSTGTSTGTSTKSVT